MSKDGVPPSFHFFAGLTTGCISATLLQPADLLKTRVQQARSISLVTAFRDILAGPNSLKQLWRGTLPSVIRTGVGSALYFSSLNALRQHIARSNLLTSTGLVKAAKGNPEYSSSSLPRLSNIANLTTGAIARASAGFIMMPITVIKVRYESSLYTYKTIWGAGTAILNGEGMKGFFAGFGVTAVRDAPYAGLYVLFYEQSKRRLSQLREATPLTDKLKAQNGMKSSTSVSINFISGVSAAVFATAITNPFDAVKTRLQLMPGKYRNMFVAGRRMVREDGVQSLFDGLGLRIGRKALSSALAWTLYEELVRQAESKFQEKTSAVGCCHSVVRDGEQSSPYSPAIHGDSSSRAIASASAQLPENSSPRTSSQLPDVTERSRTRRHLPLGEQFNAPIRPHVWTSKRQWTRAQLDRERREFFDTRVTGHAEIWASLKVVVGLLADGDVSTAQSILDAAAITVPTGDLKNGSYDEAGNHYSMPEHIISDPQNLVPDHESIAKGEMSNEVTDDDEAMERRREEKGKAVLKTGNIVKIKARLSDRGGPDIIVTIGKEQAVRVLVRTIRKEANLQGRVKIAYMGKILKDAETLQAQGWREGHVVNALVFDLS